MTKYTSNEQYEEARAVYIDLLETEPVFIDPQFPKMLCNLLKQSKWIGNADDDNTKVDDDA